MDCACKAQDATFAPCHNGAALRAKGLRLARRMHRVRMEGEDIMRTTKRQERPELAYDYTRQVWLRNYGVRCDGAWLWEVEVCGHSERISRRENTACYSCTHAGEVVIHHAEIH